MENNNATNVTTVFSVDWQKMVSVTLSAVCLLFGLRPKETLELLYLLLVFDFCDFDTFLNPSIFLPIPLFIYLYSFHHLKLCSLAFNFNV